MKTLLSSVAVLVMFCGLAMGQAERGAGFNPGPPETAGPQRTMIFRGGPMIMRTRGPMSGRWWQNPEVAQRVGLSDLQVQQLDKIYQDGRLKGIDLRAALEKQQVILQPLLRADHPDEDLVMGQIDKVSQARADLEKARVHTMLAMRGVLTPDQWKKLHTAHQLGARRVMMRNRFRGRGEPNAPAPPSPPGE